MSVSIKDKTTGEWVQVAGGTMYADSPIGSIIPYGGTTAPNGFLLCQGQAVSRTTYAKLFAVIGTSFGSGDSSTTFNVPDLRETVPVGSGTRGSGVTDHDTYTVGQFKDDQKQTHTHSISHTHTRGAMNITGVVGEVVSNGAQNATLSMRGQSGAFYAVGGTGPDGYTVNYNNNPHQVTHFDASRSWTGNTSGPSNANSGNNTGRTGATTHGKQLGVNYIIKATQVGVPADFAPVDVVQSGNMNAVTSNAVTSNAVAAVNMDSAMSIDTTKWATAGQVHAFKVGQLGIILWGGNALVDISTDVNNATKVAQLPVEFRPNIAAMGTLMTIGGTVADIILNAAGEVFLCSPSGTLKTYNWAWGQVVFVIGN